MSDMKICKNCIHVIAEKEYFMTEYYCTHFLDKYGRCKKVDSYATCNRFEKADTMKDAGYTGSSSCFLTSACVGYLGKPDDCIELTTLREFRDTKMKQTEEGKALVDEYYRIAPSIVEKIEQSQDKDKFYKYIYLEIIKCLNYIGNEQYDDTIKTYKNMVIKLKNDFNL